MAVLKFYNDIVSEDEKLMYQWMGMDAICFKDIDSLVESIPQDDGKIELLIDCRGGSVQEGWAIYDALRASGKEISAEICGKCASMGTIILMAAPKERRIGRPNASLCIHDPYIPEYTLADAYRAEDLRKIADDLDREKSKFLDVYVERTGSDREELNALMSEDKYIDMKEAERLGFIDHIKQPTSAKTFINNKTMSKKKKSFKDLMNDFKSLMSGYEDAVAMDLTTATGDTLTVEKESGDPAVGDAASPDGEHLMPDGTTIVVVDGVITEIRPAEDTDPEPAPEEDAKDKEIARLNQEVADLKAKLETEQKAKADAEKLAKTKDEIEILNAVKIAGGREALARLKSGGTIETRQNDVRAKAGGASEENSLTRLVMERKEREKEVKK